MIYEITTVMKRQTKKSNKSKQIKSSQVIINGTMIRMFFHLFISDSSSYSHITDMGLKVRVSALKTLYLFFLVIGITKCFVLLYTVKTDFCQKKIPILKPLSTSLVDKGTK